MIKIFYLLRHPFRLFGILAIRLPYFSFIRDTADYQCRISFETWFRQKILNIGGNKDIYWPVDPTSRVYDVEKIIVGVDAYPGIMNGCYIQGKAGLEIGDYTQIGPNVAIITSNHDVYDTRKSISKPVRIGKYCWLGAGAKIMPGVELGDWTIVGAGAVVTKSFPEGYCILGGIPAHPIKKLEREKCVPFTNKHLYHGFIRADKFEAYRKKHLDI